MTQIRQDTYFFSQVRGCLAGRWPAPSRNLLVRDTEGASQEGFISQSLPCLYTVTLCIQGKKAVASGEVSAREIGEGKRTSGRQRAWHERATQGVRGRSWGHGQARGLGRQFGSGCSDGKGGRQRGDWGSVTRAADTRQATDASHPAELLSQQRSATRTRRHWRDAGASY